MSAGPTGNLPVESYCGYWSTNGFGIEKIGWFNKLNASNRNSRFRRSRIRMFFIALKSMLTNRGPRRALLCAVPKTSESVGRAKVERFHQFRKFLEPPLGLPTRSQ